MPRPRAALRHGPPGDGSLPSSARRKRGRLRRHHRGPTAGRTDKKGDPFRCPTLESDPRKGRGICGIVSRRSTSALRQFYRLRSRFHRPSRRFQRGCTARCERQLPRPTASDKISRNRVVGRDFFCTRTTGAASHNGVTQGCPAHGQPRQSRLLVVFVRQLVHDARAGERAGAAHRRGIVFPAARLRSSAFSSARFSSCRC